MREVAAFRARRLSKDLARMRTRTRITTYGRHGYAINWQFGGALSRQGRSVTQNPSFIPERDENCSKVDRGRAETWCGRFPGACRRGRDGPPAVMQR